VDGDVDGQRRDDFGAGGRQLGDHRGSVLPAVQTQRAWNQQIPGGGGGGI